MTATTDLNDDKFGSMFKLNYTKQCWLSKVEGIEQFPNDVFSSIQITKMLMEDRLF